MSQKKDNETEEILEDSTACESDAAEEAAEDDAELPEDIDQAYMELRTEFEKMQNYALRTKADYENYKKRNDNISRERYEDGKLETLISILPVLDSVERALALDMDASLKEGLEKIKKQFLTIFDRIGVTEIPAEGEIFDPNLHNALMQVEDEENSGKVVNVYEKGYKYGDRVLRHAGVVVAK